MSFSIIPTARFKKEAKRLLKKYASLKDDLLILNSELSANPLLGSSLGNNIYKVRVAIKSKGKGKSGGARIITYAMLADKEIYLLTIYDKSEIENIDDKDLKKLVQELFT